MTNSAKAQTTNQTLIDAIASDNAWAIIEVMNETGWTIDEAVDAQVEGAMNDMFDEDEFDAPYDTEQLRKAYRSATMDKISNSATELRNYASSHEGASIRDYDAENEIGEAVVVYVIEFEGEQFHIIYGDDEDRFHEV